MSKKLFLLALNYYGTPYELKGCIDDVNNIEAKYKTFGFNDVTRCVETAPGVASSDHIPTRPNFTKLMSEWILSAKSGDFLVFHYSGHGTHQDDLNHDEVSGQDQAICLLDGNLIDDEIHAIMVKQLPAGVQLRCLFDCCHSGTIMDLAFNWKCERNVMFSHVNEFIDENKDHALHDILMISGCRDDQTSADAWIEKNKEDEGAMTWSWLETLRTSTPHMTWHQAIEKMRSILVEAGYDQVPQLSLTNKMLLDHRVEFLGSRGS